MPTIEPVDPSMFDEIHHHLLRTLDDRRGPHGWRVILDYPWRQEGSPYGYVLLEGAEPVGFIGTLFVTRLVDGRKLRFCNVTSWVAKPEFQSDSALLALQLRRLPGHVVTNLTPNEGACKVFRRLGFQELESARIVMLPRGFVGRSRFRILSTVEAGRSEVEHVLDAEARRILADHDGFVHHAVALGEGGSRCHVVYSLGRRWRMTSVRIHALDDPARFVDALPDFQSEWRRLHGALLSECDARMVKGHQVPRSYSIARPYPRLYRGSGTPPERIDNLYSELVLLGLG